MIETSNEKTCAVQTATDLHDTMQSSISNQPQTTGFARLPQGIVNLIWEFYYADVTVECVHLCSMRARQARQCSANFLVLAKNIGKSRCDNPLCRYEECYCECQTHLLVGRERPCRGSEKHFPCMKNAAMIGLDLSIQRVAKGFHPELAHFLYCTFAFERPALLQDFMEYWRPAQLHAITSLSLDVRSGSWDCSWDRERFWLDEFKEWYPVFGVISRRIPRLWNLSLRMEFACDRGGHCTDGLWYLFEADGLTPTTKHWERGLFRDTEFESLRDVKVHFTWRPRRNVWDRVRAIWSNCEGWHLPAPRKILGANRPDGQPASPGDIAKRDNVFRALEMVLEHLLLGKGRDQWSKEIFLLSGLQDPGTEGDLESSEVL